MASQLDFLDGAVNRREGTPNLPEGFRYGRELISAAEEGALLARGRKKIQGESASMIAFLTAAVDVAGPAAGNRMTGSAA